MHKILDQSPEEHTKAPVAKGGGSAQPLGSNGHTVGRGWQPDGRDNPPGGQRERLEEVAKQGGRLAALVVSWTVDLIKVKLLAEASEPDLRKERATEIEELVLLVVTVGVGIFAQVLLARHASPRVGVGIAILARRGVAIDLVGRAVGAGLLGDNESNKRLVEDIVRGLRVGVGGRVLQDLLDVLASVLEQEVGTAGMVVGEVCHVVDLGLDCDIARFGRVVRLDLGASKCRQGPTGHRGGGDGGGGSGCSDCGGAG